jgi:serine/threonine protein kinase
VGVPHERREKPVVEAPVCPTCHAPLPADPLESCICCAKVLAPPLEQTIDQIPTVNPSQQTSTFEPSEPNKDPDFLPLSFGNYELLGELGRGGMGIVYKARQKLADRLVALKVMRDHESVSAEERQRFTAEVRALGRVTHPHIVAVFEVGEEQGCPFFTMEYVDGKPLSRLLREGKTSTPAESARLIEDLAGAVQAAHAVGVLHRDIKPGNILIGPHGEAKLTDFGLAKHLDQDTGLTAAGSAIGTPSYMPPEQASGDLAKLGPRTDVYALGATFYELLTGRPPFVGETVGGTLARVLRDEVVPPRTIRPGLSPELEAVCLKCLEKNPAHRYGSAQELSEDLARWRNGEATRARPWSWRRRLARSMRRRWRPITAALVVLLVLGAFVFTFVLSDPEYRARRAMQQVDRAIRTGERTVLVGPIGPPKWSRRVLGIDSELSTDPAEVFTVKSNSAALIELAPAAHHQRFRISAELRTRSSSYTISWSGIYFANAHTPADPAGFAERLLVVCHNRTLGPPIPPSGVAVNVFDYLLTRREGAPKLDSFGSLGVHFYHPNPEGMGDPWQYVEVEVTPETIRARWRDEDGSFHPVGIPNFKRNTVSDIPVENLDKDLDDRVRKKLEELSLKDVPRRIEYTPGGALGLYVDHAAVEFRNVVYEQLPEGPAP